VGSHGIVGIVRKITEIKTALESFWNRQIQKSSHKQVAFVLARLLLIYERVLRSSPAQKQAGKCLLMPDFGIDRVAASLVSSKADPPTSAQRSAPAGREKRNPVHSKRTYEETILFIACTCLLPIRGSKSCTDDRRRTGSRRQGGY
jgi:hypothetical protein